MEKACNWCAENIPLVPDKKYCYSCLASCYKECVRCKKPFPEEKYFLLSSDRCNTCYRRYKLEEYHRGKMADKILTTDTNSSSSDSFSEEDENVNHPSTTKKNDEKKTSNGKGKTSNGKGTKRKLTPGATNVTKPKRGRPVGKKSTMDEESHCKAIMDLAKSWYQSAQKQTPNKNQHIGFIPVFFGKP
jgi:hypothetical protein